jgi:hypothetical protein
MSAKTAIPMKTHSKPVKPPVNTSRYIRVVQGKKIRPSKGQIQELKAVCHNTGLKSHQSAPTNRGPIKTNRAKMQHIAILLLILSQGIVDIIIDTNYPDYPSSSA